MLYTATIPLATEVVLRDLAEKTAGKTGSDIEAICKHATLVALKRLTNQSDKGYDYHNLSVLKQDFADGFNEIAMN